MRNIGLNLGFSSHTYGHPYNQVTNYKCDSRGYDAKIQRDNEECHLCNDWGGCGGDCQVSRIFCPHCGNAQPPLNKK